MLWPQTSQPSLVYLEICRASVVAYQKRIDGVLITNDRITKPKAVKNNASTFSICSVAQEYLLYIKLLPLFSRKP